MLVKFEVCEWKVEQEENLEEKSTRGYLAIRHGMKLDVEYRKLLI